MYLAAAAAVAALMLLALGASQTPSADGAAKRCAHAASGPAGATQKQIRRAVFCLIARKRAKFDRKAVRENGQLRRAAQKHTRTMLATNCLGHHCPGEPNVQRRLRQSGYLDNASTYGYGENTGCGLTPKAMVSEWMRSSFHRGNILRRTFRHLGVGAVKGAPRENSACNGGITFTALFAWRRR